MDRSRIIPEELLYDIRTEEIWEYGVNGIHSEEHFDGFNLSPIFPDNVDTIHITDYRINLMWTNHIQQFKALDFWQNIKHLKISVPVSEEITDYIKSSPKFAHMETISLPGQTPSGYFAC